MTQAVRICSVRGKHFACRMAAVVGPFCELHSDHRRRPKATARCNTCGVAGHNARTCDLRPAVSS